MRTKGESLPRDLIRQLGRFPDAELSRRFGISRSDIRTARRARGIERCHTHTRVLLSGARLVEWLGEQYLPVTTADVAEALDLHTRTARRLLNRTERVALVDGTVSPRLWVAE